MAMPWPPPMQAEPMPYFSPFLLSLCTRWAEILDPEAARGCPRATAPPQVLNFSIGMSKAFWQERACAANASLISTWIIENIDTDKLILIIIYTDEYCKSSTWSTSPMLTPVFSSIAWGKNLNLFSLFKWEPTPCLFSFLMGINILPG